MGGKTAIALGLAAGLVVGGLIVGGAIALVPAAPFVTPSATPAPAASPAAPATVGPSAPPSSGVSPSPASPSPTSESPSALSPSGAFGIGEPALPLVLLRAGGATVGLAGDRGKPVWVDFLGTWCPSCVDEVPGMAGFQARRADTGLVTLAVDAREDEAAATAFFKNLG